MIEVRKLTKVFDDRTILNDVSVTLEAGKIVSLIGPSGGGKTTLLRCLNGLEDFQSGEIIVGSDRLRAGEGAVNHEALSAIRQRVGMVFQQWNLFAHRTALGNIIEAPIHVKKIPHAQAVERAKSLLERVGMSHRANAYPHEMSGGEQQRVAIARALAMDPVGLLLDEPTSALDPERVGEVIELLREIASGLTIVLVTHEMRFARDASDRVLMLYEGSIVEDGSPFRVLESPDHPRTRAFLGMNK